MTVSESTCGLFWLSLRALAESDGSWPTKNLWADFSTDPEIELLRRVANYSWFHINPTSSCMCLSFFTSSTTQNHAQKLQELCSTIAPKKTAVKKNIFRRRNINLKFVCCPLRYCKVVGHVCNPYYGPYTHSWRRIVTHTPRGSSSWHPGLECLGPWTTMSFPQILSCQCGEQNYSTNIMTRGYKYPSDLAVWNRLGWLRGESLSRTNYDASIEVSPQRKLHEKKKWFLEVIILIFEIFRSENLRSFFSNRHNFFGS